MLTVFGHFEEGGTAPEPICLSVTFDAGPNPKNLASQVSYTLCDGTSVGPITFGPSQSHLPIDCVIQDSWILSGWATVSLNDIPCGGGDPPNPDNVFTVERQSDGFSTYSQSNSFYSVNDLVRLSNDGTQCYEIMGTAYVVTPADWPSISGGCGGGSKGDVITPA